MVVGTASGGGDAAREVGRIEVAVGSASRGGDTLLVLGLPRGQMGGKRTEGRLKDHDTFMNKSSTRTISWHDAAS